MGAGLVVWGETMAGEKKEAFYNRSLERALQIVSAFNGERRTLTLAQLSEILGLSKATILRLCSTLVRYGFLRQDQESRQYSLGMRLFELGSIVISSFSLGRIASTYMTQLQVKLGKTVFLGILDDGDLLYIDKREDPDGAITFTSRHRQAASSLLGHARSGAHGLSAPR